MADPKDFVTMCDIGDKMFGPSIARGCRWGFDFTLLFEQAILSIVPCAIFLSVVPARLSRLHRAQSILPCNGACLLKLVST
jgi:ATP-binding cassette, subfamily C (CFTR/MRP), member 1